MKKKHIFSLTWVYEPLGEHPTFFTKRMFGSLAIYFHGKMVLVLSESPGKREHRGKSYPYDIWSGVLFPTEREFHGSILKDFPALSKHAVLPKWLYLPMCHPDFETVVEEITRKILEADDRFGIFTDPK